MFRPRRHDHDLPAVDDEPREGHSSTQNRMENTMYDKISLQDLDRTSKRRRGATKTTKFRKMENPKPAMSSKICKSIENVRI